MLKIALDLLTIGLSCSALVVRGVDSNRTSPELARYRRASARRLAAYWKNRSISTHPVIVEYHRLHDAFGAPGQSPAPEKLIMYVRRNRDLTGTGPLVDCYNLVSARTLLSIGAHDLGKLSTPVTLRVCTGDEVFVPLGQSDPGTAEQRHPGEYAYIDPDGRIICRLEVLQGDYSKVTPESRDIVFFLQGNAALSAAVLLKGTWLLAEMVERFCGGQAELLDFSDNGSVASAGVGVAPPVKPFVPIEMAKRLQLRKATVLGTRPLPGVPGLSSVIVRADREIRALAVSSVLPADPIGMPVVCVDGLHPLTVAGMKFTGGLLTGLAGASGLLTLAPEAQSALPDGTVFY